MKEQPGKYRATAERYVKRFRFHDSYRPSEDVQVAMADMLEAFCHDIEAGMRSAADDRDFGLDVEKHA